MDHFKQISKIFFSKTAEPFYPKSQIHHPWTDPFSSIWGPAWDNPYTCKIEWPTWDNYNWPFVDIFIPSFSSSCCCWKDLIVRTAMPVCSIGNNTLKRDIYDHKAIAKGKPPPAYPWWSPTTFPWHTIQWCPFVFFLTAVWPWPPTFRDRVYMKKIVSPSTIDP